VLVCVLVTYVFPAQLRTASDTTNGVTVVRTAHTGGVRRSIEVEYWVVDLDGRLTAPDELTAAAPGVEREFVEPLLEIKTSPCETTAELRDELFERIGAVLRRADDLDMALVPLSTPLATVGDEAIRDLPSERTRIQDRVVGPEFEYVRHCAGTHIHFEQQPGRSIEQLNTLIALDPAFALVNSSRHFDGTQLAAGARSKLYRRLAYAGLANQGQLWPYVDCREDWTRRLDARYEEFVTAAQTVGIDRSAVEACFDPESAVWTPVQFRETFGTVEWRSPDTALPSEIIRLADTMARIIEQVQTATVHIEGERGSISEDTIVLPTFDAVTEYVDRAIEDGLSSERVCSYLSRMGFDISAYSPAVHDSELPRSITPQTVRQLRLDHAAQLRRDVLQAAPVEAD